MSQTSRYRTTICTSCRHKGTTFRLGYELIEVPRRAIAVAVEGMGDLVRFARQYALLYDGGCCSADRPGKLGRNTLARVPAAIRVLEECAEPAQ